MSIKADQVVKAYIDTRDKIALLAKAHKEQVAELTKLQDAREKWLDQQLDASGTDSGKVTGVGTYFRKKKEFVSVDDMDTFVEFLSTHKAWDLLNKAVNKSAALERMGDDRDLSQVPGIKYSSEMELQVRRS